MHLRISDHAWQRWNERVGEVKKKDIRRLVMGRLRSQIRLGIKACDKEGFDLDLFPDLRAVLVIDPMGYWVVQTFYRVFPGESEISTETEEVHG